MTFLNLPESTFVRRVFSIFDEDVRLTAKGVWKGVSAGMRWGRASKGPYLSPYMYSRHTHQHLTSFPTIRDLLPH